MRHGARSGIFRFADLPAVEWRLENIGNDDFAATLACERMPRRSHSDQSKPTDQSESTDRESCSGRLATG